tara:strand:- start:10051 stop:10881 length:831 start_codon:yes stop_codon:yes gene_type:complete
MKLIFKEKDHSYKTDGDDSEKWVSVTSLIGKFKEPFDKEGIAKKSSKNKKSKWYGMTEEDILTAWNNENKRALSLGSWYHKQREDELIACNTLQREGIDLLIFNPIEQDGIKIAPDQNLVSGVYPEHMVYLKSAKICGQADRVEVVNGKVNIYDYKTNKEIKKESYKNWEGVYKMMKAPINNIQDCNLMHYALQLSIYMYIVLKHNHSLEPGKMQIHHIKFEIESVDDNGYPVVATDAAGDPIINEVIPYDLPYMKKEVNTMIKHLKLNFEKLTTS